VPVLPTAFSPATVSRVALINAIANGVIVVTGGAVRLTGSGLGCPTWPRCTESSFVPTDELAVHGVIEFGNRTLTALVGLTAIAVLVAVFRSARRDLRPLAVWSFLGIPAQALLGGVTVLTELNPWIVAAHFLVSAALVALTTTLWLRSREPGVGQPLLRRPLVLLAHGIAVVTAAVVVVGTIVTGTGPHSGDVDGAGVPTGDRIHFDPEHLSQLHADLVFLLIGLTVALLVALAATDAPGRLQAGIVFADLSSFTALTEAMGDVRAAAVVSRFGDLAHQATARWGGRVLKQIGDAVLLVFFWPQAAVACALDIVARAAAEPSFPAARAGVHWGPVVYREGDYYGAAVNLAARLVTGAERHQVVVSTSARERATDMAGVEFVPLGPRTLKGLVQPQELYAVRTVGRATSARLRDPVCHMELSPAEVAARLQTGGVERVFCSEACLRRFVAAPEQYPST
jgi:cytochrome c oxidase assembly protein subunit 15